MALGLLGAALAGGGEAIKENATDRIRRMHEEGVLKMRQEFQRSERIAGQQFTAGQNQQDRGFRAEQGGLDRSQQRELAKMRESGADRRSAAQIAAQNYRTQLGAMVQGRDAEGNLTWYNPLTGDTRTAPGGFDINPGWTERDTALMNALQSEYEALSERAKDMGSDALNDAERARLEELPQLMQQHTRGVDVGSLDDEVGRAMGGDAPPPGIRHPSLGGGAGGNPGAAPPPRPGIPSSYDDLESQVAERRRAQGLIRSTQEEAQQVESEITRIRGLAAQTNFGPRTTPQQREQLANEVRQRTDALMQQHELTDAQRSRLENAVETILQRVGQ